jgi:hypothetical protein
MEAFKGLLAVSPYVTSVWTALSILVLRDWSVAEAVATAALMDLNN